MSGSWQLHVGNIEGEDDVASEDNVDNVAHHLVTRDIMLHGACMCAARQATHAGVRTHTHLLKHALCTMFEHGPSGTIHGMRYYGHTQNVHYPSMAYDWSSFVAWHAIPYTIG